MTQTLSAGSSSLCVPSLSDETMLKFGGIFNCSRGPSPALASNSSLWIRMITAFSEKHFGLFSAHSHGLGRLDFDMLKSLGASLVFELQS